uniref:SFI1 centrin binding protein n=1 Tax=Oryzias melastigma TaxID=30732 RepID=A0A3B3BIZ9_ORYME
MSHLRLDTTQKRHRKNLLKVSGETKQAGKAPNNRRFLYRVGYNWNKGGRLKELRIRHLARKFLNIWKRNTFGQILPQQVRLHYKRGLLKRALKAWKDEWWISRREWIFTVQAECHYSSLWSLWQTRLQKQQDLKMLEKQVLKRRARTSQSKVRTDSLNYLVKAFYVTFSHFHDHFFFCLFVLQAWLLWKKMHRFALYQRKKEEKANLYAIQRLKRKSMCLWTSYTSFRQTKKISQGFYASFLFVLNAKSEFLSYL